MNLKNVLGKLCIIGVVIPGFFWFPATKPQRWLIAMLYITSIILLPKFVNKGKWSKSNMITLIFSILIVIILGPLGMFD